MGKKSRKAKQTGRQRGGGGAAKQPAIASKAAAGGGAVPFVVAEPEYYTEPTQWRDAPDLGKASRTPEKWRDALFAVYPGDRSATARRLVEACEILDRLGERVVAGVDPSHIMTSCVDVIRALSMSDFRAANIAAPDLWYDFPIPPRWSHIIQLELRSPAPAAGSSDEPQLKNVRAKDMVVLLSAAAALYFLGNTRQSSQIVHELRIHAENDCFGVLDWTDLEDLGGDVSPPMTEAEVRFFLAQLGIKSTGALYVNGDVSCSCQQKCNAMHGKLRKKDLFESIEVFAKDQVRYRPDCAQGYHNLAWVEGQRPIMVKGSDPLSAAADCLHFLRKCYEAADAEDDDVLKAAGRIDAAYCLLHGAGGLVAVEGDHVVVRDMRSQAVKAAEGNEPTAFESFAVRSAPPKDQARLVENEKRRLAASIPATRLEPGERILIAHWDVRKLWNEAMVPFDDLCRWGWSQEVYGVTVGWEVVMGNLKTLEKYAWGQYVELAGEPGLEAIRDKGQWYFQCHWCGKHGGKELLKCSQCKKAYYCDPECAKKDWKQGGHKERCRKT